MFRISKKGEEVIFRDFDLVDAMQLGLIICAVFYLGFFRTNELKSSLLLSLLSLGLLVWSLYILSFSQLKTVKINKEKRILSIHNRSLIKNTTHIYGFSEIADLIFVDKDKKDHKLIMLLKTDERIELAGAISFGEDKYFEAADVINNLVFNEIKKIP